ncbi:MAG: ABC-type transport auxiliary lipoprotein family protein [Erythrobacter sp.]
MNAKWGKGFAGRNAEFSGRMAMGAAVLLGLAGCISIGGETPESLITLTPVDPVNQSVTPTSGTAGAIAVLTPETAAMLDVTRVPVQVNDTKIAYLTEAFWVEKPARLFRRLLGETLRRRGDVLILDNDDVTQLATQYVRGSLLDMTYDAPSSSVVVRFDAMRTDEEGEVVTRRFEARESGVLPEAEFVGPALNRAANQVAGDVADWVLATP